MKRILLVLSIACLLVTLFMCFLCSFTTGLVMTVVSCTFMTFAVYLLKNNPRMWIAVAMLFISVCLLFWSSFKLSNKRRAQSIISTQQMTSIFEEDMEVEETIEEEQEIEETIEEAANENTVEEEPKNTIQNKNNTVVREVIKEVPVEKVVVQEVVKEVPKVEYVEKEVVKEVPVEKEPETQPQTQTQTHIPNTGYMYYGDPTFGYGYNGYSGYNYNSYNSTSVKIKGATEVVAGESETYTISGVNSISKNKLDIPANVSIEKISGNKVTLYFDEEYTGSYSIGYGNAVIDVEVSEA